jgi:hypothetical protein
MRNDSYSPTIDLDEWNSILSDSVDMGQGPVLDIIN